MGVQFSIWLALTSSSRIFAANGGGALGCGWAGVDERASLPVAAVMLWAMELLAELGLVVLGDVNAL